MEETEDAFSCVKVSSNQLFKNEFLQSKVNEVVLNCSKAIFEGYCLANMHVLRLLEEGKEIPKLNQGFYYEVLSSVSCIEKRKRMEIKNKELNKTFERYKLSRPRNYKVAFADNICHVFEYMAAEMATCTTNHLVLNFYNRFNKYLKERYENIQKEVRYEICRSLYEKTYKGDNSVALHYRNLLSDKIPNETNVKRDPTPILKVYYEMMKFVEPLRNKEKETIQKEALKKTKTTTPRKKAFLRTFSLLPQKSGFKMNYITIDNTVLRGLIIGERVIEFRKVDKNIKDKSLMTKMQFIEHFDNNTREYWDKFFNIKKYETAKRSFTLLKTDGKTCSICFKVVGKVKTPKKKASKKKKEVIITKFDFNDYDDVIACDPGMKFMTTTISKENDSDQYSTKKYYHDIGANKSKFQRNACYDRNPAFREYIKNMPSGKTTSINKLVSYISYALKGLSDALEIHFKNPFRKWRFTDFIKKQKTFHSLCLRLSGKTKLNEDKKVLFGMGDWSNPRDNVIKGNRRGPVKAITTELKRYCEVVMVHEFNTSRCCSSCHFKNEKPKKDEDYRVFSCKNCQNTLDRDKNAVKNIYMVMERRIKGIKLPEAFCHK
jgi:hypothetical protein